MNFTAFVTLCNAGTAGLIAFTTYGQIDGWYTAGLALCSISLIAKAFTESANG